MIKKIILIKILFFCLNISAQTTLNEPTEYRALYKMIYQRDSTDNSSKGEKIMSLLISENASLFQGENKRYNDSLAQILAKGDIENAEEIVKSMLIAKKNSRYPFKILKINNTTITSDKILSDEFVYQESYKMDWYITNEKKIINNQICIKATTSYAGRDYTAWFSTKIAISDGPYKFRGLPGLIVRIEDSKKHYTFELIGFENYSGVIVWDDSNIKKTNREDYLKAYNNFKANFGNELEQRGVTLNDPNSVKKRVKKNRNNHIEIKYY